MLRIPAYALGQANAPVPGGGVAYSEVLTKIVRAVPPCFSSRDILRSITAAQSFAKRVEPTGTDTDKRQLEEAWYALDYWHNRLSIEASATYCAGTTNGQPSSDRDQIIRAITKPYILASGISAATQQTQTASAELIQDLTLIYNPETGFHLPQLIGCPPMPSWWCELPTWVPWAGLAAVLFLAFRRRR